MNDRRVVYLDNAATTPVDPRVAAEMRECLGPDGVFGNPSSMSHAYGREAHRRVERAREEVAALVGAQPEQVLFTSGATESDNLAILGAARFQRQRARHVVTSRTEHPAVLDACRQLEREGCSVTYLKPGPGGIVEAEQVAEALQPDTVLVSLMHVNNEIGVVQDVAAVGRLCRDRGVLFHVDAAQGLGKLDLDVHRDSIDLLSLTAHKVHGPKGVGALCVRREPRIGLVPLQFGGGQERGLRSGTLPTHQVVGMGAACRIARLEMVDDAPRIAGLRSRLWNALKDLPGVLLNGDPVRRVAGILNVSIDGVEGESLLLALCDLAVSSGSACASTHAQPSYVLRALGRSDRLAQSSLRLSLGRFTTEQDVDHAAARIREEVLRLRECRGFGAATAVTAIDDPRYGVEVQRRLRSLAGAGRLPEVAHKVTGRAGDREQGCSVELEFAVDDRARISQGAFLAFGCPHVLAAASWLVERAPGWTRADLEAWDWQEAARALEIPPAKFGRLLTLQDAVRIAARNWASEPGSTV
ncbi:MAG TPA: aminotransferase class V-fold PLP-dependent enzyme [Steroidobacteraceae bacterium]|nr:aminotransferase class V-fold PLP-dependent enzyme [Steroidobacteraceae bacterium]